MRDRLRPSAVRKGRQEADPEQEARAAQALDAKRGRATIAPPPRAGKAATALVRPLLPKTGMGLNELKRRWTEVIGTPFADKTSPEKLTAGVLTLRAPGPLAPFLQQQAPLLIERLRLAGAQVKTIRIEQRAVAAAKAPNVRPIRPDLTPIEEAALADRFGDVADPGLKAALLRLGRAVRRL
ncbi:MAG: DciA family protein [Pseudomonadota bacterium]